MPGVDTFPMRLRWARQQRELTLLRLSERTGYAMSYLSQLEHGIRSNPTRKAMTVLGAALGVRYAYLAGEVPGPVTQSSPAAGENSLAAAVGAQFRAQFQQLCTGARADLVYTTPERRCAKVMRFLLDRFPDQFTPLELAWRLGMSYAHLDSLLGEQVEVSHTYLEQLSYTAGLPLRFFTVGELGADTEPQPAPTDVHRYMRAILMALERNLSPDELEALIREK